MKDHVKVRKEYVTLVRAGKNNEAQIVLESIWERKPIIVANVVKDKNVPTEVEEPILRKRSLDSLCKIRGIGKKTVKDIKVMFKDVDSLIVALKENRVPLRDDVVTKLMEELIE